jgi:hypothetical protein
MIKNSSDVALNSSSTLLNRYKQYVDEIKNLDQNDPDLTSRVSKLAKKHGVNLSDEHIESTNAHYTPSGAIVPTYHSSFDTAFTHPFFYNDSDPFGFFDNRVNKMFSNFDSVFERMCNDDGLPNPFNPHDADFNEMENNMAEDIKTSSTSSKPKGKAYCKYTSSFTTFDENGKKKSKVISGVEKIVNGKRYVSKKKQTIDGDDVQEEQLTQDVNGKKLQKIKSIDSTML